MSDTYMIYAPNGRGVEVDKKTKEIYFAQSVDPVGKYTKEYTKVFFKAWEIMENSPYKDYKPIYLDPNFYTGQASTLLEFKDWQSIYLKEPIKGSIAPWTKAEKAYYKSLKTKRERYKYLIIRSGIRSTVIDIPYEAYCNVDEKGNLINKDYKELYKEVEANRGMANMHKGWLFMAEWELAAGILGDIKGFVGALQLSMTGFKARTQAVNFLLIQLGHEQGFKSLYDSYAYRDLTDGIHKNPLKAQMLKDFAKNPPYDEFGMLPFLDELIGVDWVIDVNKYQFAYDEKGRVNDALKDDVEKGILKDPRDIDSTPESRWEFDKEMDAYKNGMRTRFDGDNPNHWSKEQVERFNDTLILTAKLAALTPPQGYTNAPYYYSPERLEWIYKRGYLDKLLDPRIPAIYRYNFPRELRAKILAYAKEHNIKD
ncbi:hypothetical protein I4S70_000355 [Campylobacter coli]|nr:hypothetical protein [Campylobacter coli]EAL7815945.1 hypothetical protein [Campylobacter coli]EGS7070062.1 hypothetical protein [Campylobacter coli]EHA5544457.1 hypothetical protein [Campylobacter coli]EHC5582841.1 hypothetical protein [Campylobacter coli]